MNLDNANHEPFYPIADFTSKAVNSADFIAFPPGSVEFKRAEIRPGWFGRFWRRLLGLRPVLDVTYRFEFRDGDRQSVRSGGVTFSDPPPSEEA